MAAIGAVFALFITGTELSVVVFLGLIMLAGIVVNNAIVLIDRINQLRTEGIEKIEAIIRTSKFEDVRNALAEIGVNFFTLIDVKGYGLQN